MLRRWWLQSGGVLYHESCLLHVHHSRFIRNFAAAVGRAPHARKEDSFPEK
jgi:hypothetical protein